MKKPNLLVLIAVILLIAAVAVLAAVIPQKRTISDQALPLSTEEAPVSETTDSPLSDDPSSAQTQTTEAQPAAAYLVVTIHGMIYEPIPLAGEGSFTIAQDENTSNTVHVNHDSIWMEHSTCDNQDCVNQGTVSLDNMKKRVLTNMIICLPNDVVLELHTPETLEATFGLQM